MPTLPFGLEQFCSPLAQVFLQLWYFIAYLNIPLPIGIIGGWRWSVWVLRRVIGMWYRAQEPNGYSATTAVITPVYNEEPELFRAALRSWAANGPSEIIAVIDHTDKRCMEQFSAFEAECAGRSIILKMLITQTPGKRPALADGILAATSEIVFLVDSDTIWDPDVLPKALAPFIEPEVGGVTMRQRVWNPHSTAQRIFDVYLDIRYIDEIRYLTAFGDAVTCLSGRTAVYRRFVALAALEDLMEETFWGRRVISGDDKALTLAVQSRGWKVRYQENACVYTPGATVMQTFLKQRLRWARNSWRADLKAVGSRWTWRNPFLAFHLVDRLLQPITTLVAPLYLGFALFHGHWPAALFLISWWFVSRSIKIWPHLRKRWTNIRVLPWYIFFNYWSAVMKIYAFFTMNQQGWITRWSRSGKAGAWIKSLQSVPSYAATAATVGVVAFFVHNLREAPVRVADLQEQESLTVASSDNTWLSFATSRGSQLPLSFIGQCQAPWLVTLPGAFTVQPVMAKPLFSLQTTDQHDGSNEDAAAMLDAFTELCVLDGEAKGACTSYQVKRVESPVPWQSTIDKQLPSVRKVQEWLSFDKRFVAVTGANEAGQLCFWQDPEKESCTGYAVTISPTWRKWWHDSGVGAKVNQFSQGVGVSNWPSANPTPAAENSLCILQGASQGECSQYGIQ